MSNTFDIIEYEKVNPKTQKTLKNRRRKSDFCGIAKSQIYTKKTYKQTKAKRTQGEKLKKLAKSKNNFYHQCRNFHGVI